MRSPGSALVWKLCRRHRWGLGTVALFVVLEALGRVLVAGPGGTVAFRSEGAMALVVIVPFAAAFTYFLAVFSYGPEGDLAGRASMFPPRHLLLLAILAVPLVRVSAAPLALAWSRHR